jgi:hypothetical protein
MLAECPAISPNEPPDPTPFPPQRQPKAPHNHNSGDPLDRSKWTRSLIRIKEKQFGMAFSTRKNFDKLKPHFCGVEG